jgi:ethanolamine transporter EutH
MMWLGFLIMLDLFEVLRACIVIFLGLNFNPKALVRGAYGFGAECRASKKLGRNISY